MVTLPFKDFQLINSSSTKAFFEVIVRDWKLGVKKFFGGVPKGSRTPVAAVKGRSPRPLDDGDT